MSTSNVATAKTSRADLFPDRLTIDMPDFTRVSWTDDRARRTWEGRIQRIVNAWMDLEWRAIVDGVRRSALAFCTPDQLVEAAGRWAAEGLGFLPLAAHGTSNYGYSSTSQRAVAGQPVIFRVALGTLEDIRLFKLAFDEGDEWTMGELLGYPECCRQFFKRLWVDERMCDTTWPMACGTPGGRRSGNVIEIDGIHPEANILWRWVGPRFVSHLPCSFECAATIEHGRRLRDLGRRSGFETEMAWLDQILSWPVAWSARHGIAEVKTPFLKVSTRTDATASEYVVRYRGSAYPEEGARGLHFPYEMPGKRLVTASDGYRAGLDNPIAAGSVAVPVVQSQPSTAENGATAAGGRVTTIDDLAEGADWYWRDNGFKSLAAMDAAHRPIVEFLTGRLRDGESVLDLGGGNGALLRKLIDVAPGIETACVEIDAPRLRDATRVLPPGPHSLHLEDIFAADAEWSKRSYDWILLMPGRLIEAGTAAADALRTRLASTNARLVVYGYGDWLKRYGSIDALARAAGLVVDVSSATESVALAALV